MLHDRDVAYSGIASCITVFDHVRVVFFCIRIAGCQQVARAVAALHDAHNGFNIVERAAGEPEHDARAGVLDLIRRAALDGDRADGV